MSISTPEEIIAVKCPSSATDPRLTDLIDLAKFYISENIFLTKFNLALALLVCHQLTLEAQGNGDSSSSGNGAIGGIRRLREGELEKEFNQMFQGNSIRENNLYLSQTPAGQELLMLYNACILMPRNRFVSGR